MIQMGFCFAALAVGSNGRAMNVQQYAFRDRRFLCGVRGTPTLLQLLSNLLAITYKGRRSHAPVTSKFGAASAQLFDNKRGRILKNDLHHNPLFSTTSETPSCPSGRHLAKSSLTFPPFCLFKIVAPAMGSLFCSDCGLSPHRANFARHPF